MRLTANPLFSLFRRLPRPESMHFKHPSPHKVHIQTVGRRQGAYTVQLMHFYIKIESRAAFLFTPELRTKWLRSLGATNMLCHVYPFWGNTGILMAALFNRHFLKDVRRKRVILFFANLWISQCKYLVSSLFYYKDKHNKGSKITIYIKLISQEITFE